MPNFDLFHFHTLSHTPTLYNNTISVVCVFFYLEKILYARNTHGLLGSRLPVIGGVAITEEEAMVSIFNKYLWWLKKFVLKLVKYYIFIL